jgi:hypothetical protein
MLEDRTLPSCALSLLPSEAAPQLVGERIIWTATATDCGANPVYQFRVGAEGGALHVVRDFSLTNSFAWAPMQEGTYDVQVIVKQGFQATDTESTDALDVVNSRVTGSDAVITPTLNPLVALYSVPAGPAGAVHVEFSVAGDQPSWRSTNELPSVPGESTNVFVAGMLPNTTYQMRHVFSDGTTSSPLLFTTGSLSSTLTFPTYTVPQAPGPQSDSDQDMIYHVLPQSSLNLLGNKIPNSLATDLSGRVVWYFDPQQSGLGITNFGAAATLLPGGTVLGFGNDAYSVRRSRDVLREIDLAGDPVRETNIDAINAQLTAMGQDIIYGFSHDAKRFPDGSIVTQGITERVIDINGTPTNYVGNTILVLNQDLQLTWVWNSFDYLDVNRGPTLGEVLHAGDAVPTAVVPNYPAVDWVLTNTVNYSPADGNLIMSIRNQDWVVKIDYRNGEGDGHVIWRLGKGGDFTVNSTDPNPWFSHQHDSRYLDDSTLEVFDNGNTRNASDPTAHSRGQVWKLDEQSMTATLVLNLDMGNYSDALGSAQRLSNGNFFFDSGRQGNPPWFAQSIEVSPDGAKTYVLQDGGPEFHSYRVRTLYDGISDKLSSLTTVAASTNPSVLNQPVTFTATVNGGGSTPTGTVQFQIDGRNLGQPVSLMGGTASVSTSTLSVGPHTVAAIYNGDQTYLSSSDSVAQNVQYGFSGFLRPLNQDLSFRAGRTIPIAFQLTNFNGDFLSDLSAVTALEVVYPDGTTHALNGLHYDAAANRIIDNWRTRGLAAGSYTIQLALLDGTVHTVTVQITARDGSPKLSERSNPLTPDLHAAALDIVLEEWEGAPVRARWGVET